MNIRQMYLRYIAEQRELLRSGDPAALQQRTIRDYAKGIETHILPRFGHMRPSQFRPMHAAMYLREMRSLGRPVRGNREISMLGSVFDYGLSIGAVETNPCKGVRRNREQPRDRLVSIAEVNMLLELAEAKGGGKLMVALIALTVALTGRRRNEVLWLQRENLTPEGIEVEDSKTRRYGTRRYLIRWSPLLRRVIDLASSSRNSAVYVFPTRFGNPYTDSSFRREWASLMQLYERQTGERFRAHDLRALYVSTMLGRGAQPNTHRSEATMRRVYDRRRIIEVEPLA